MSHQIIFCGRPNNLHIFHWLPISPKMYLSPWNQVTHRHKSRSAIQCKFTYFPPFFEIIRIQKIKLRKLGTSFVAVPWKLFSWNRFSTGLPQTLRKKKSDGISVHLTKGAPQMYLWSSMCIKSSSVFLLCAFDPLPNVFVYFLKVRAGCTTLVLDIKEA